MRAAVARALIALAAACLGESRRSWALAMQGELEAAIDEGRPMGFASGCLIAAWREMPNHEEGRFVLANYALALGVIVPMAALQFACAAGLPFLPGQGDGFDVAPVRNAAQQLYLASIYLAAEPALIGLWLLLGLAHLRLAWVLLERDWPRVVRSGSLAAAATAALAIFTGVMFVADVRVVLQAAALPVELAAIAASARWHAGLVAGRLREGTGLLIS